MAQSTDSRISTGLQQELLAISTKNDVSLMQENVLSSTEFW
jgi:hypothetical protein